MILATVFRHQKQRLIVVLILTLANAFCEMLGLGSLVVFFSQLSGSGVEQPVTIPLVQIEISMKFMPLLGLSFFLIKALVLLFYFYHLGRLVYDTETFLNLSLFEQYLKTDELAGPNHSEIIRRNMLAEVPMFTQNYMQPIINLFTESLVLISILTLFTYFFKPSLGILLVVGAIMLVGLTLIFFSSKPLRKIGAERQFYNTENIQTISSLASGWKEIRANDLAESVCQKYRIILEKFAKFQAIMFPIQSAPRALFELLLVGLIGVLLAVNSYSNDSIQGQLTDFSTLLIIVVRIYPSAAKLGSLFTVFSFSKASNDALKIALKELRNTSEGINLVKAQTVDNKIQDFAHSGVSERDTLVELENFQLFLGGKIPSFKLEKLVVKRGDFIVITGPNGSGKTTFMDVLARLPGRFGGNIRFYQDRNGVPLITKYCTQQPYFSADNLFRQPMFIGLSESEIRACLLDSKLFKEEEINDFVNMENCQFFSGGEKIKITIAALLTKSSDIYLLDEPASALDKVSIERLKALLAKCKNAGAAMIVISHQNEFDDMATNIIDVGKGTSEEGLVSKKM
jgi:ABC-type multidrug transport system fused ATPase/permease subunit